MEDQKIMLNDILNFSQEEIDNAKITLNMTEHRRVKWKYINL